MGGERLGGIHLACLFSRNDQVGLVEGDLPSRKGLLQIGQSMEGFKSLFGTRSSSADVATISHGSMERWFYARCRLKDFGLRIPAAATQVSNLPPRNLLTYHPRTLD